MRDLADLQEIIYAAIGFSRLENCIALTEQVFQVNMYILSVIYLFIPQLNEYI